MNHNLLFFDPKLKFFDPKFLEEFSDSYTLQTYTIRLFLLKGLVNPMMSCSLSPNVDDAKVADVVIPHVLRRPHVQGPQYMHKFLLVDRSSNLYTNSF